MSDAFLQEAIDPAAATWEPLSNLGLHLGGTLHWGRMNIEIHFYERPYPLLILNFLSPCCSSTLRANIDSNPTVEEFYKARVVCLHCGEQCGELHSAVEAFALNSELNPDLVMAFDLWLAAVYPESDHFQREIIRNGVLTEAEIKYKELLG